MVETCTSSPDVHLQVPSARSPGGSFHRQSMHSPERLLEVAEKFASMTACVWFALHCNVFRGFAAVASSGE
jgi:hypothetical protein